MKYIERLRMSYRMMMTFEEFLRQDPTLLWLAEEADMTPEEFILSELHPEVQAGETFRDWLLRNVKDVLEARLWRDSSEGYGDDGGMHFCRNVNGIEFSPQDAAFILRTFGEDPDVKKTWQDSLDALVKAA